MTKKVRRNKRLLHSGTATKHWLLDLNELHMWSCVSYTCRKWTKQILTVLSVWLLKNRCSASDAVMLRRALETSYVGDNC